VSTVLDTTAAGRSGEYCQDGVTPVPIPLSKQTSIANCQANAGSWYLTGSNLYVRTHDGRAPDSSVLVLLIENILAPTNLVNIWIDGVEGWGDSFARHNPSADNTNFFAWRYSSSRFCSSTSNLLNVNNIAYCYSWNCVLSDQINSTAGYDGFNYHSDAVGLTTRTKALEYNCTAIRVGANDGGKNDNASTVHDNCSLITLNANYSNSWGPVSAHVLGAHVILLGVNVHDCLLNTIGDLTGSNSCIQSGTVSTIDGTNTKVWVKKSTVSGARYGLYAAAGGDLYDWGGNIDTTTLGSVGTTAYP